MWSIARDYSFLRKQTWIVLAAERAPSMSLEDAPRAPVPAYILLNSFPFVCHICLNSSSNLKDGKRNIYIDLKYNCTLTLRRYSTCHRGPSPAIGTAAPQARGKSGHNWCGRDNLCSWYAQSRIALCNE